VTDLTLKKYNATQYLLRNLEERLVELSKKLVEEKRKNEELEQQIDYIKRKHLNPDAKMRGKRSHEVLSDNELRVCQFIAIAKKNGFKGNIIDKCIEIAAIAGVDYKDVRKLWKKRLPIR